MRSLLASGVLALFITGCPLIEHALSSFMGSQDAPGSLSGVVLGPDSKVISNGTVTAVRSSGETRSSQRSFSTAIDDSGRFRFDALPAGEYHVRIDVKDSWLLTKTARDTAVISGKETALNVQLELIEMCDASSNKQEELTDGDYLEIVKSTLEEALAKQKIPSYVNLASKGTIVVSTANIQRTWIPTIAGHKFLLLSSTKVEAKAHREQRDFMYLGFEKITSQGSCVAVIICNLWADGTSTIETGKKTLLGEGCLHYLFRKESGKWIGTFVTGSIS